MLEYIFFPIVEDYWGLGTAGDALAPSCLMKTMYLLSCTNWLVSRLQVPRNKKASEPVDLVFLSPFCFLAFGASGALQRENRRKSSPQEKKGNTSGAHIPHLRLDLAKAAWPDPAYPGRPAPFSASLSEALFSF